MPGFTLFIAIALAISAPAMRAQDPAIQAPDVVHSVREIHLLPQERLKDRVAVDLECIVAYLLIVGFSPSETEQS